MSSSTSSSSSDQVIAVIIASAQSVAKVFVIGLCGVLATRFPSHTAPLLPPDHVGTVARFSFHVLTIALIYSTTAMAVSPSNILHYWFLIVGALAVLGISYGTATFLARVQFPSLPQQFPTEYAALRIAATFPNIVALPILIFPSLCEYSVVHEGYVNTDNSSRSLEDQCVAESNTMIFCYFFSWSFTFWTFGYGQLMNAANAKAKSIQEQNNNKDTEQQQLGTTESSLLSSSSSSSTKWQNFVQACQKTFTSAGFIGLLAGFLTGCIPPLQQAMFESEGALRFLGDALETLGQASSPLSTLVVAASLVPVGGGNNNNNTDTTAAVAESATTTVNSSITTTNAGSERSEINHSNNFDDNHHDDERLEDDEDDRNDKTNNHHNNNNGNENNDDDEGESPIMSDPNFGPTNNTGIFPLQQQQPTTNTTTTTTTTLRSKLRHSITEKSTRVLQATIPQGMGLLLGWYLLSRLIVSPALVVGLIMALDCSGSGSILASVPAMAKLVLILNSCLPGALIVVQLLKSNPEQADCAGMVAKIYLPTYLVSIITIAAWTAIGLLLTLPDEDGLTFCERL